jgi:hypothetical protein
VDQKPFATSGRKYAEAGAMILTKTEIRMLLGEYAWRDVWTDGKYRLQKVEFGYSKEDDLAKLQGKLSIMLEAAKE